MPRKRLTHEEFVVAWQSSATLAEAAEKIGVDARSASLRAHNMRKAGVPLRLFGESSKRLDIEELSRLAEKVVKQK